MRQFFKNLIWLGVAAAVLYWVTESAIHTFIFGSGPLTSTLLGEHDPNEIWMRFLLGGMFVVFGWIAERAVRAERRRRDEALRLNQLLQFADRVKDEVRQVQNNPSLLVERSGEEVPARATLIATEFGVHGEGLSLIEGDSGALTRTLTELAAILEARFKELYVLLHLTHEINMGLLLDEVLEHAYETLRSVIPYDRLSVALFEDDGRVLRARWVHSNSSDILLGNGYAASIRGSSLQGIIHSGEPRIINDLAVYLAEHPASGSTRLMVDEGIRASLTCPLVSFGKPIGFIFFSSRSPGIYRNVHVDIFKLIAGHLAVVVEKSNLYQQILVEKAKSDALLLNVMPGRIATRLKQGEATIAESLDDVGILFADIVGFTDAASRLAPERLVSVLQQLFATFDQLCDAHGVEKIKTIGDAYLVISASKEQGTMKHLHRLADFALAIQAATGTIHFPDGQPLHVRIGMSVGPAAAGVITQKKFFYDIWGDTVNIASRMASTGAVDMIQVSARVAKRLQDAYHLDPRGEVEVKGKGTLHTFFLMGKTARL